MDENTRPQDAVLHSSRVYRLHSSRDATYSGYGVYCDKCSNVRLTLAEFRKQLSDKPEQIWHCPICGSVAEFRR
jgi:hypothetical protein